MGPSLLGAAELFSTSCLPLVPPSLFLGSNAYWVNPLSFSKRTFIFSPHWHYQCMKTDPVLLKEALTGEGVRRKSELSLVVAESAVVEGATGDVCGSG